MRARLNPKKKGGLALFLWEKLQKARSIISSDMTIYQNQKDCLDLLLNMNIDLPFDKNQEARKMAMKVSQYSHNIAEKCAALTGSGDFDDIYWQYLLLEAQNYQVDSGLLYLEKNRIPK